MKTIPIFNSSGEFRQIGEMQIDEAALPATPDFVFTIGFNVLEMSGDGRRVTRYELVAVSPILDHEFSEYLRQKKPHLASYEPCNNMERLHARLKDVLDDMGSEIHHWRGELPEPDLMLASKIGAPPSWMVQGTGAEPPKSGVFVPVDTGEPK